MNVTKVLTKEYENKRPRSRGKNKPNFTPHSVPYHRARTILPVGSLKADPYYLKVACINAANFSAPQMLIWEICAIQSKIPIHRERSGTLTFLIPRRVSV
jgi:hypothetical protein